MSFLFDNSTEDNNRESNLLLFTFKYKDNNTDFYPNYQNQENDNNNIYDAPSLILTKAGSYKSYVNDVVDPPNENNKYNQIYNENTKTYDRRSILSRLSDDSKITSCTRRKPHPAIKIANFIANKKYNEEKGFVSKNTAMSAFKVLDTSKNCGNSIKAKRIINFADQYKNDKTVYRPVAKKNEVLKHYIT